MSDTKHALSDSDLRHKIDSLMICHSHGYMCQDCPLEGNVTKMLDLFKSQTALLVKEAEDRVIEVAHRKPCDCGSTEHLPVPVRSVTGGITYYCQFSRVAPSSHPQEAEKDV